jgi:hypothetical protein
MKKRHPANTTPYDLVIYGKHQRCQTRWDSEHWCLLKANHYGTCTCACKAQQ